MRHALISGLTLTGGIQFHHRFDHRNDNCPFTMFSFRLDTNCIHIRGLDFEFPLFSFCGSAVAAVGRFFISLCLDFDCAAFIYFSAVEPGVNGGKSREHWGCNIFHFPYCAHARTSDNAMETKK